jgi:hypothetical protein
MQNDTAMYFYNYIFMCLYIATYLYYQVTEVPLPGFMQHLNVWVSWGFLLWGGYQAGRIIVDCLMLSAKNQMTPEHVRNGILLAVLHFLPTFLMSVFMLKEGFAGK